MRTPAPVAAIARALFVTVPLARLPASQALAQKPAAPPVETGQLGEGAKSVGSSLQARDWIDLSLAIPSHDIGQTPGFNGDFAAATRSNRARVILFYCSGCDAKKSQICSLIPRPRAQKWLCPGNST